MFFLPGHKVTVSLVDGSALTGRTALAWPGRLRLREVTVSSGAVPGLVWIPKRSILTVQVI